MSFRLSFAIGSHTVSQKTAQTSGLDWVPIRHVVGLATEITSGSQNPFGACRRNVHPDFTKVLRIARRNRHTIQALYSATLMATRRSCLPPDVYIRPKGREYYKRDFIIIMSMLDLILPTVAALRAISSMSLNDISRSTLRFWSLMLRLFVITCNGKS